MTQNENSRIRPRAKFFFDGDKKFFVKGVTYGPFKPDADGDYVGRPEQVDADLALMRDAGLNVVRIYHSPPRWFLDRCAAAGMRVLVTLPWEKHIEFLRERSMRKQIAENVRAAVRDSCGASGNFRLSGWQRNLQHDGALARHASSDRICRGANSDRARASIRTRSFPMPRIRRLNICSRKTPIFPASTFTFTISAISKGICCVCKISPASIRSSSVNSAWTRSAIPKTSRPKCSAGTSTAW